MRCPTCRASLHVHVPTMGTELGSSPAVGSMVVCAECLELIGLTSEGLKVLQVTALPPIEQIRVVMAREVLRELMRLNPPRAQA